MLIIVNNTLFKRVTNISIYIILSICDIYSDTQYIYIYSRPNTQPISCYFRVIFTAHLCMQKCHTKKNASKSRRQANTSTNSCHPDGARSGNSGLLTTWSRAVKGRTAVRYLSSTLPQQASHCRGDGGGAEPAEILHCRTRRQTPPSASSARKGAQKRTCVRKA